MTQNIWIVYDSVSGNTEKTAQAIARGANNCNILHCNQVLVQESLQTADCVVLLSPTRGNGNISPDMKHCVMNPAFWDRLPKAVCIITAGDSIGYKKTFCASHKQIEILAEYHGKKVIASHVIDTPQRLYHDSCVQWIQQALSGHMREEHTHSI